MENQQQQQIRRQAEQADFYAKAQTEASTFDDPIAFEHWRQAITPMAQLRGVDPGVFTFDDSKKAAKDRKLVSDALDVAVKRHGPEILNRDDVSIQLADGRTVSMKTARSMAGGGLTDQAGANVPITPIVKPDTPNTTDEYSLATFAKEHGYKSFGEMPFKLQTEARKAVRDATANAPTKTLEQQYLDAIQSGDTALAAQLKQAANIRDNPPAAGGSSGGLLAGPRGAGLTGDAYLRTVPAAQQDLIKKIANYEMDLSKVTSLRGGEREQIASMVAQYDPTFDMSQYASRTKLRADFNSGKGAQNIRSLNTAIGHLATLKEKAAALENRSIPLWNTIANAAESHTGDPRVVEFTTAANAVEGELASLFKGTGATDAEIRQWRQALNSSQSPEQSTGAINTAIELMHSRLAAIDSQWEQGMGKPRDFKILTDRSRAVLQKMGVDVSAFDPESTTTATPASSGFSVAANGKTYTFQTQAALDAFKKDAGLK